METIVDIMDLFSGISWLWYVISVVVAFGMGALWYTVLFGKQWVKAVNYVCLCGANISDGEECTCKGRFPWEMLFQFVGTALIGLMYFILTPYLFGSQLLFASLLQGGQSPCLSFRLPGGAGI